MTVVREGGLSRWVDKHTVLSVLVSYIFVFVFVFLSVFVFLEEAVTGVQGVMFKQAGWAINIRSWPLVRFLMMMTLRNNYDKCASHNG